MGNLGKKTYDQKRKIRAMALMKMFKNRIEHGLFKVEVADWWSDDINGTVTLRIDVHVEDLDVLDALK